MRKLKNIKAWGMLDSQGNLYPMACKRKYEAHWIAVELGKDHTHEYREGPVVKVTISIVS